MLETKLVNQPWHTLNIETIEQILGTRKSSGLTQAQEETRKKFWGKNILPRGKKLTLGRVLLNQFTNPLIYILVIAAALTWWLGEYTDMTVILMVVGVNTGIGFFQEYRANRIFEKLQEIVRVNTIVTRDGKIKEIDAENLVPGDVISLRSGQKVPADARLVTIDNLEVNESVLTGESIPVNKQTLAVQEQARLGDRNNMVYMGTTIEQGEAIAITVSTGAHTELGKISILTQQTNTEDSPLKKRITKLGNLITIIVLLISAAIMLIGIMREHAFAEMIKTSIAIAVAAIPEGLPAAISVILAVASQRILKRKGLVKKLVAAETLGSTTVICTDKTGTLTYGEMRIEKIISSDEEEMTVAMALANEAVIETATGDEKILGEGTDRAKLKYFLSTGGNLEKILELMPRKFFIPFDSIKKYICSFHSIDHKLKAYITGAPETIIEMCKISDTKKEQLLRDQAELAQLGYRLIATAEKEIPYPKNPESDWSSNEMKQYLNDMNYIGLAAIRDPIREDVKNTVIETRNAGIKIIMVTGDHLLTAKAIASELGFATSTSSTVTGDELDLMSENELAERIGSLEIIARVSPKHKLRIINALKSQGAIVAMTGDGVNDAPALKNADIGVAIGSGTDVSKEAADLVLLDDSFTTITAAIKQGRIGFDNIRKVSILLFSNAFSEIILIISALILAVPFPITAIQILWANMIEGALPILSLAFEPGEPGVMERKPLPIKENILYRKAMGMIIAIGVITDLLLMGVFLYLLKNSVWDIATLQTLVFTAISIDTILYTFAFKSLKQSLWRSKPFNNKFLLVSAMISFAAIVLAVYLPVLNRFLGTVPLGIELTSIIIALGVLKLTLVEIAKKHLSL